MKTGHRSPIPWILLIVGLVFSLVAFRIFILLPQKQEALIKSALGVSELSFLKLQEQAKSFKVVLPNPRSDEVKRAQLGRKLFFDTALSNNGKIACASCHKPELSFTDGLAKAIGMSPRARNTPTLINSYSSFWFYWDGRVDSLAAQSLNPLEDDAEHGFSRTEVARHIFKKYRNEYETLFGEIPESFIRSLPAIAKPLKQAPPVSAKMIRLAMVSQTDPRILKNFGNRTAEISSEQVSQYREKLFSVFPKNEMGEADKNFENLPKQQKMFLNSLFANVGLCFEAYEKGIVAVESHFDVFVKKWIESENPDPRIHFSKAFGIQEFLGFQLFLGRGACQNCHTGAQFKDNQFHNIGLPQENPFDLGRSQGILIAQNDPFNCRGIFSKTAENRSQSESCQDLVYLNSETPEAIGAFKTPTLRNIAQTGPYMRDGRFETLRQVLEHYNRMENHSGVGFREETLKPLHLTQAELFALEAFLKSLSSEVRELY